MARPKLDGLEVLCALVEGAERAHQLIAEENDVTSRLKAKGVELGQVTEELELLRADCASAREVRESLLADQEQKLAERAAAADADLEQIKAAAQRAVDDANAKLEVIRAEAEQLAAQRSITLSALDEQIADKRAELALVNDALERARAQVKQLIG
jgi:chromosome segregation ATPase